MPPSVPELHVISSTEFANRFATRLRDEHRRFVWFLGAGCSISSGIPAAGGLVQRWLEELRAIQGEADSDRSNWATRTFPKFDHANPAAHYAQVFGRRHPAPADRQAEIEILCERGEPSYGYATLAQLISLEGIGQNCNTVFTTNFDDLIADALYMYGERRYRPQVIAHDAMARFARVASPRPTIVKLHGDALFDPKSLSNETRRINQQTAYHLRSLLLDSALVFAGYGGNDESILHFFRDDESGALAQQIYWVGRHNAAPPFHAWLAERGALRVDLGDFDQLMHLLRGSLKIAHLDRSHWERTFTNYFVLYERFETALNSATHDGKNALRKVSRDARHTLPNDWDFYSKTFLTDSPKEKDQIFREGIDANPESAVLLGMYASFLEEQSDFDKAETFYKRAIKAAPHDSDNLGNYANFLSDSRDDAETAEYYYRCAIEANPGDADNLGNYANFLSDVRHDAASAEIFYKRALEADPAHSGNLGNYASFLMESRKDSAAAEHYYQRAVALEPNNADFLANYAQVLLTSGKNERGCKLVDRALQAATDLQTMSELLLYRFAHDMRHGAEALHKLKAMIAEGVRSLERDFSMNIQRAEKDRFPEIDLLRDLAKVIAEDAPTSILNAHEAWRNA